MESLNRHKISHIKSLSERKNKKCDRCNKSFTKMSHLQRHSEQHDLKENGLKYHCGECSANYCSRSGFDRHVKSLHKGMEIEPSIILDETNSESTDANILEQATEEKSKDIIKSPLSKLETLSTVPKPKKGKWIVQLKRIDDSKLFPLGFKTPV